MMMRKLLIGVVLAMAFGLGGWLGWRWYTTPVPPRIALEGAEQGVIERVEAALQAVRQSPRSAKAWGALALVLDANGYPTEALSCYRQTERFDPGDPGWPYLHGLRLLSRRPSEGITLIRRALDLTTNPQDRAVILFRLARAQIEQGELDEAKEHLQALRALEGDSPHVHFGLALLAIANKDRVGAREHLSRITDIPFARRQVYNLLASLTENREEARRYQDRAARLPGDLSWPDPFETEVNLAKVDRMSRIALYWDLTRQGRHQEALEFLRRFVAESPDAEVCYILGYALCQMNQLEEAVPVLRATLHLDPRNVKAHYYLGASLFNLGERRYQAGGEREPALELFRQAVAAEEEALALQADHGYAHLIRGRALKYLGRTEESLQTLRQALLCCPEFADMHLYLGETLAEAGLTREALEHLENAARLAEPDNPRPAQTLKRWRAKIKKGS